MTRVLMDYHHHALAESAAILFADRFGWELSFPVGMDWATEGVWQFEVAYRKLHGMQPYAVAQQYLEDIWQPGAVQTAAETGETVIMDRRHPGRTLRGVSLARARDTRWDYIVSSLPDNDVGLHALAQQTGATFGVQIGNEGQQSRWDLAAFALCSSTLPGITEPDAWGLPLRWRDTDVVIYHQEFSLERFAHTWPPLNRREVASWVNCFPEQREPYMVFTHFARAMAADLDFKVYGAYGSAPVDEWAAGDISDINEVARRMQGARTAWHGKYWSDGFGHVIHNWFAIGRPVIGHPRYYRNKLAGPLWVEGETSLDVERLSEEDVRTWLRRLRDDDELHHRMSINAASRFRELVSFDTEAEAIRTVLGNLR